MQRADQIGIAARWHYDTKRPLGGIASRALLAGEEVILTYSHVCQKRIILEASL